MRVLKVMLFATAMFTVFSCSKEEDDPKTDMEMLLGQWNLEELSYSGTNKYKDGTGTTTVSYTGEAVEIDVETVFLKDGIYNTSGGYTVSVTSVSDGEKSVESFTYSDIDITGNWSVEGNRLTTTNEEDFPGMETIVEITEGVIQELTPNRLVLVYEYSGTTEVWGMEVEVNTDAIQVFSR